MQFIFAKLFTFRVLKALKSQIFDFFHQTIFKILFHLLISLEKIEEEENCSNTNKSMYHQHLRHHHKKSIPIMQFNYQHARKMSNISNSDDSSSLNQQNGKMKCGTTKQTSTPSSTNTTSITTTPTTVTATSILLKNFQTRNIRMMSLTIISITCIFIILTLPIMLFIILMKLGSGILSQDPNCKSIIWSLVNIFMYTNHSINFVLYCLTGSKFRTELATLFLPKQVTLNTNNLGNPHNFNNNTNQNVVVFSPFDQTLPFIQARNFNMRRNNTFDTPFTTTNYMDYCVPIMNQKKYGQFNSNSNSNSKMRTQSIYSANGNDVLM
jgi:hypothetical protein